MTIVCGFCSENGSWMGSDSIVVGGTNIYPEKVAKVRRIGSWFIGFSGSFVTPQLVECHREKIENRLTPEEIAEILMGIYKEQGYKQCTDHPGPPCYEQEALLMRPGEAFTISGNGAVGRPLWGFMAIGSGADFAMGAAHALAFMGKDGHEIVRSALLAACALSTTCGGEIEVISVDE